MVSVQLVKHICYTLLVKHETGIQCVTKRRRNQSKKAKNVNTVSLHYSKRTVKNINLSGQFRLVEIPLCHPSLFSRALSICFSCGLACGEGTLHFKHSPTTSHPTTPPPPPSQPLASLFRVRRPAHLFYNHPDLIISYVVMIYITNQCALDEHQPALLTALSGVRRIKSYKVVPARRATQAGSAERWRTYVYLCWTQCRFFNF